MTKELTCLLKKVISALVGGSVGWSMHQKVLDLIPGQGMYRRQPIDVSLTNISLSPRPLLSLPLPLSPNQTHPSGGDLKQTNTRFHTSGFSYSHPQLLLSRSRV